MPGPSFYDRQHVQKVLAQQSIIADIFNQFILSVSPYLRKWNDTGNNNVWVRNQVVERAVDRELLSLEAMLKANISAFQVDAWDRSNTKNDDFIRKYIEGMSISTAAKEGMFTHNLTALKALQKNVDANGLSLSDRVWSITQQTKSQIEFYLDSGVAVGRNANGISSDVRQMLHNPDKRFRRVRNGKGNLVPSRPMKDYHPGQGVYRSAYMNALRTSATTTNIAYRSADYERWSKQDFVLGIEVQRSGNHKGACNICDAMVGKYPKTFKFTGWHPFCICYATPIVMEPEELTDYLLTDKVPERLVIKEVPETVQSFVNDNKQQLSKAFWMRDNFTTEGTPLRILTPLISVKESPRAKPKRIKNDDEKAAIQQRWNNRAIRNFNQTRIEQKLGLKKAGEMTFEEANELRGNINYGRGREYGINCQSCVVANELRRRGYNVTAMPNLKKAGNIPYELSRKTEMAWIDPVTMKTPLKKRAGGQYVDVYKLKTKTLKQVNLELEEITKEIGRYHINFVWKGCKSGHIITIEKLSDGKMMLYDPQTGKMENWKDLSKNISLKYGVSVLRVDNLLVNTDIIDGIVKRL